MAVDLSLINASNGSGEAARALVTGSRLVGSTVIPVDAQTNYPTKFIGTTGTLDTNGRLTVATMQVFKGHTDGATIVIDSFAPGYTDKGNSAGDIVVIKPTTLWSDIIAEALRLNFNDDGTLKPDVVGAANIISGSVGASEISSSAITQAYAQRTSAFSTTSSSAVQLPDLSVTITTDGTRRTKLTVSGPQVYPGGGYSDIIVSIWRGAVGSGTRIKSGVYSPGASGNAMVPVMIIASELMPAGTYTYNVGLQSASSTATIGANVSDPLFLLAELG